MQLFGWRPKTAAQYLWLWSKQGLVKPLGGKSDLFFNLAADPAAENRIEAAIRRVMPGAVIGPLNVLNESAIKILRMLSPAAGPADLEKRYTAAWLARRQAGERRGRAASR